MSEIREKLEEGLLEKYERCKSNVDTAATEEDAKNAEREMEKILADMQTFVKTDEDAYAKEEERRITEDHNIQLLELEREKLQEHQEIEKQKNDTMVQLETEKQKIEKHHNQQMLELEREKLQEHREIEDRRNAAALTVEQEKRKLNWKNVAFDMAKIVVPAAISVGAYFVAQTRVLQFEETGRINSTPGRDLHLPKLPSIR